MKLPLSKRWAPRLIFVLVQAAVVLLHHVVARSRALLPFHSLGILGCYQFLGKCILWVMSDTGCNQSNFHTIPLSRRTHCNRVCLPGELRKQSANSLPGEFRKQPQPRNIPQGNARKRLWRTLARLSSTENIIPLLRCFQSVSLHQEAAATISGKNEQRKPAPPNVS